MKLKLRKLGEAAAVGFVDIALEKISPTALNLGRGAIFATAAILNATTEKFNEDTETVYLAETPLLIRSVANALGAITDFKHTQKITDQVFNSSAVTGYGGILGGRTAAPGATSNSPSILTQWK